jgi:dTDP-4-dehydrorhamnose reductase
MLIIVLGNKGSLGSILSLFFSKKHDVVGVDINDLDLSKYDNYKEGFANLFDFNVNNTVIINCVGIMGAKESEADPFKFYEVNGVLPYKLKQFFTSNLKNHLFIQISSETVYGKSTHNGQIFSENDLCLPQHTYGLSKLISEQLLKASDNSKGGTIILRTPVLLFKDQKYPNALNHIRNEINEKGCATLFGTGEHKRKYAIAENFALDLENLLEHWSTDRKKFTLCEVVNMPGTEISTKEFVDILSKKYDLKFQILFKDNPKLAFSLLSSSNRFSLITNSTVNHGSVENLVKWIWKNNE